MGKGDGERWLAGLAYIMQCGCACTTGPCATRPRANLLLGVPFCSAKGKLLGHAFAPTANAELLCDALSPTAKAELLGHALTPTTKAELLGVSLRPPRIPFNNSCFLFVRLLKILTYARTNTPTSYNTLPLPLPTRSIASQSIMSKVVLVTGGTGLVGEAL